MIRLTTDTPITIQEPTIDRLLIFLADHPERAECLSRKINQSIDDILTIEEYAVKVNLHCHQQGVDQWARGHQSFAEV